MKTRIVHVRRAMRNMVYIQWVVDDYEPPTNTGARVFQIQKASNHKAPESEWTTVVTNYLDSSYIDVVEYLPNDMDSVISSDKPVVYRVGFRDDITSPWKYSDPVDLNNNTTNAVVFVSGVGFIGVEDQQKDANPSSGKYYPNPDDGSQMLAIRNRKTRNIYMGLVYGHGRDVAILKKKTHGKRCNVCYSIGAGATLNSNCKNCYGTGWTGGYDSPILSLAKVRDQPPQDSLEPNGRNRMNVSQIGMLAFPKLNIGDVIVELNRDKRWEVASPPDEKVFRGVIYAQESQCFEMSRTAIIYSLQLSVAGAYDLRKMEF